MSFKPLSAAILALSLALPASSLAGTQGGSESGLLGGTTLRHPSPYPHYHRPRYYRPQRRFGDARTSFYFGIGGVGHFFLESEQDLTKVYRGGGGFNLMLGARLNRFLAFELSYMASFQQTRDNTAPSTKSSTIRNGSVQAASLDAKVFFIPGSTRIEPFFQVGVGAYLLAEDFQEELAGFGFDIGVGVDIRLTRSIALGARFLYRGFHVDNSDRSYYKVPTESAFLNTLTLEGNIQFHF